MARLLFGTQLSNSGTTWPALRDVVAAVDGQRWNSLWTFDHLYWGEETTDCFEGWSLLSAIAALTSRLRIGCLVTANTFRNPALLAKMAATVDHISGGRLELGLGASWVPREHEAYGIDYPTLRERQDRLEEAAELIRLLFRSDGPVNYSGKHYRLVNAEFHPKGLQKPAPPLMIGGGGERRTLRTLALYGDVMNVFGIPTEVARKNEILDEHCREVGRDPKEIARTVTIAMFLSDDDVFSERARNVFGEHLSPEDRERYLAIGRADRIIRVLEAYLPSGISSVLVQGVPLNVEAYRRLDQEVLAAFD